MLRSRGRVFYTIARLEKVWSCVDSMECATVIYCKSGPLPVAGGGSSEPSEPPLGTGMSPIVDVVELDIDFAVHIK